MKYAVAGIFGVPLFIFLLIMTITLAGMFNFVFDAALGVIFSGS